MADAIVILNGEQKRGGKGMASVTAEVMLYFGIDDPEFRKTVDILRFIATPQMNTREIIDLLNPVWDTAKEIGYDEGYESALNDER